ncbi:hypothetical protein KC19_10G110300 [Ceratodon purpureus]|uniref:Protein kinase domain-containing protein n=1 Tax=Ceratodon purpureus TaxID=3225 RepID=A0A8T0GMQ3_CERPU|nr:hypothetical protein KC19_10G110300 [Ceratodon purpureus]
MAALNNASIVGILPEEIGDITTLTTLELTGNPNLTGNIPHRLTNTQLITLDLHDNAFYGEIPDFGSFEWPLTVDLSGNRLNGSRPLDRIWTMKYLQKLNLGRNDFEGEIPDRFFDNMTQLVQLDLSNNRFNGTLPTLTMIKYLQTLDMSNNRFTGTLPNLTAIPSLLSVDLSRNNLSGTLPALTKNLQTLNLSRNAFSGSVLLSFGFNGRLNTTPSVVDLSHNQLTAALDSWNSSQLGTLQELYLDFNLITGTLNIGELSSRGLLRTKSTSSSGLLRVLSVMNNTIDKVVYDGVNIEEVTTVFRLGGNPYCNVPDTNDGTRCFCKQICFNSVPMSDDNKRKVVIIAVVSTVTSLLVILVSLAALMHRNRRYKRYLQLQVQQKFEEFEVKPTIFPYNQLRTATRDFHPDMKLGQGAYGAVYKGILQNGSVVAVKQLFGKTSQGIDEFLNEVVLLTGMKHRNLVNLKGCCIREQQRLLVYEYVDNHDIDHVLLSAGPNKALLSWPTRLKICLGVARGLHYLHALAHPRIIHRDIKASNVLLAQNYETKIADFGLAFLFPDEESYVLTKHVAGTKGYLAPEYASYGQLSDKVDVFSFGVLCLEVVSGRRNIDEKLPPNQMYLSKWAWELHRVGNLMDLVDSTMSLQDEEKQEVQRVINIALLCIQNVAEERPTMERVVAMLQGDSESETLVLKPGNEEYLDTMRLRADVGMSSTTGLATVTEDLEESASFMNLSRRGASGRSDDGFLFPTATLELSDVRVR